MSTASADFDWTIAVQESKAIKGTFFATATRGPMKTLESGVGHVPHAETRLVTPWKHGRLETEQAAMDLIAKHEAGIP